MKKLLLVLLSLVFLFSSFWTSAPVYAAVQITGLEKVTIDNVDYYMTFGDEFDGNEINFKEWSYCPNWYRQGDYCLWSDSMANVDGQGHLVLSCDYDNEGNLLCGAVRTRGKFEQCYGYFEASVKLQQANGFWSAFWLMPNNIDAYGYEGGSDGTEIDIYEAPNYKNKNINYAIHFDGYDSRHKSIGTNFTADVYDGQYHRFSLLWDEHNYIFYIDGVEMYRITSEDVDISFMPAYLKLSLESSLGWTGKPKTEDLPNGISVDYVRVYQRYDDYWIENPVYGDLNMTFDIDSDDIRRLRKYLVKSDIFIKEQNADVNCDMQVDVKDYLILRKYFTKEINKLPHKGGL